MELDNTTRDIMLLDIYGGLLTPRQLSLMKQHLEEDLSLGEIAELEGISRQGVRDCIVKGESVMLRAEEKLESILRNNDIRSITVVRMEVPCCGGIEYAVRKAIDKSGRDTPFAVRVISTDGRLLH